jgi:ABC-type transport system involved in cytochrome c biogenesis ATPase subunit
MYLLDALNVEEVADMRLWIADCPWADLDDEQVAALSDNDVIDGVREHYEGGIGMFLADRGI